VVNKLGNDTGLSMDTTAPRCTTTMFRLVDPVAVGDIFRKRRTPCRVRDGVSCQQNLLDIVLSPVHNSRPTSPQFDDLLPHLRSTTISALDNQLSSIINPDLRIPKQETPHYFIMCKMRSNKRWDASNLRYVILYTWAFLHPATG
jgi:hypothetical protein